MTMNTSPFTSRVRLGVVCPMANERATAERFVREVLSACAPFRFKSLTFFAVLDRVSRDGTLELLRELEAAIPQLRVVWAPANRCVVDAYLRGYREASDSVNSNVLKDAFVNLWHLTRARFSHEHAAAAGIALERD